MGTWQRAAKSFVEKDRSLWLLEQNYDVHLLKLRPLSATPKNDIILAWPKSLTNGSLPPSITASTSSVTFHCDETITDLEAYESGGFTASFDQDQVEAVRQKLCTMQGDEVTFEDVSGSLRRKVQNREKSRWWY